MGPNSIKFIIWAIALVLVLSCIQFIRMKHESHILSKVQIAILLIYSYYFTASVNWRYAVCLLAVTAVTYCCGITEENFIQKGKRGSGKVVFVAGTIAIIGILGYFKYSNFFLDSFFRILGTGSKTLSVILPIGISFYIFSALSYVIDVYRGDLRAEKDIVDFALFMAFFTKITAGPIVRWRDFAPQVKKYRGVTLSALNDGVQIFVFGLFKKMVLADHLGVFVDDVFFSPGAYGTATVWWAALSYSLQIYLDFSGYSDMAIGLSKILGFDFKANFDLPYIARGFSDFWSRWHISLSQWFRDYLYIPLGGSRKGVARTYFNLFFVMLVSGLWHGAGWTFILWGVLHGIASCITKVLSTNVKSTERKSIVTALEVGVTFLFVTLFWTIFRADNFGNAFAVFKALFTIHSGIRQPYTWTLFSLVCVVIATLVALFRCRMNGESIVRGFYPVMDLSKFWSLVTFFTVCGLIILLGYYGNTAFIYGAF